MKIRLAEKKDIENILTIYNDARAFMKMSGNPTQWQNGGPTEETLLSDIKEGCSFVVEENGEILATFYFRVGCDRIYDKIYDGSWLDNEPYAVIHRVAVSHNARGRGVSSFIFAECFARHANLKIDTHKDNKPMQGALIKAGFMQCGIIYLETGDERIAFQKNK